MDVMTKNHIRHLPVVLDGQILGVISIGDVVKHIFHKQKEKIRDLTDRVVRSKVFSFP
jgi:signal-transduction protein with cAMP-binding, CBS, and nucleotidyltransferase domain